MSDMQAKNQGPARTLQDQLLAQFPPDLAALLIEFSKYLARLDGDYLIFMARKCLRLYDLLLMAGAPISQTPIVSHHVLDQSMEYLKEKNICLIDDTLILGTTLAGAKERLLAAGARTVSCHVFCVDDENWCKDLIIPDKYFSKLDHARVLTLCAREVTALSIAGIPYLSDFPFSEAFKLTSTSLGVLHSITGWATHTLTTPLQDKAGVSYYSCLPDDETMEELEDSLGPDIIRLLELVKIRTFSRKVGTHYWTRIVPIVTLSPMFEDDLTALFDRVIGSLQVSSPAFAAAALRNCTTTISKLRLIQYVLSLFVGTRFLEKLSSLAPIRKNVRFDLTEASRLFGPWMREGLQELHETISRAFGAGQQIIFPAGAINIAPLPEAVIQTSRSEFVEFVSPPEVNARENSARGLFTDLVRAFVGLHKKYEIPARKEVHRLGRQILAVLPSDAPYRDRLKFGFAWRALVECLLEERNLRFQPWRTNLMSLMLDCLIDMGIAVPVLCLRDGVLFRAYRYGEDVPFGDQECALSYDIASGYLQAAKRVSIPRLTLEKLIVSLLRVGVAKEFLAVLHGLSGIDGAARIGFHLHGAVPILAKHETLFADEQETWISRYLVERGVLKEVPEGRFKNYDLGLRPEAAFMNPSAPSEARQLGLLIGTVSTANDQMGRKILPENDLIVLASCIEPKDCACAIAAELRLFSRWFGLSCKPLSRLPEDPEQIRAALKSLLNGIGYLALNSARLKIEGYRQGRPIATIERCKEYLRSLPSGELLATAWTGEWSAVVAGISQEQKEQFEPWIVSLGKEVLMAALGIFTIELAVLSKLVSVSGEPAPKKQFEAACRKVSSFLSADFGALDLSRREAEVLNHLRKRASETDLIGSIDQSVVFGLNWINERLAGMRLSAEQVETLAMQFGKSDKSTRFSSVLWYDIIDSTGQRSGLSGQALKDYRARVRDFKNEAGRLIYGLKRDAERQGTIVYPWQGQLTSRDDEKHVFIAGPRHIEWLRQVTKILFSSALFFGLRIRALAIRADFSGTPAFKNLRDPNVEGESFWEHLSRIKEELKKKDKSAAFGSSHSMCWIGGTLVEDIDLDHFVRWHGRPVRHLIRTEIEDVGLSTAIFGGAVARQR